MSRKLPGEAIVSTSVSTTQLTADVTSKLIPAINIVTGTSVTAIAGQHYIITNAAATTVTLPASPSSNDTIYVSVNTNTTNNVIARNGNKIQALEEDLTLDLAYTCVQLRFANSGIGWVIT